MTFVDTARHAPAPAEPAATDQSRTGNSRRARVLAVLAGLQPPHFVAAIVVLGAAISQLGPVTDPDVWWHLRTGRYIIDHHALPGHDSWSLVAHGHTWVAHEWLSQVLLTGTYDAFGLRGVAGFRALGVLVLLSALAVQAFRRTTPYRALGITTLAVLGTCGGWGERPQLISFVLMVPAGILARRAADGRVPWQLIPLVWIWANLHGLWFVAVAVTGVAAIGGLIDRGAGGVRVAAKTLGVCAAAMVAAALTPNGPALVTAPVTVGKYAKYVTEWLPPSIHRVYGFGLFALLVVFVLAVARRRQALPWGTLLPVVFIAYLGFSYIRTVAPAVVLLVPYVAAAVGRRSGPVRTSAPLGVNVAIVSALAAIAVVGATLAVRLTPTLSEHAPVAATAALERLPAPQRVIDEYDIGGWLLWHARQAQPAVDGRTELYSTRYLDRYLGSLRMDPRYWRSTVSSLDANAAFLRTRTPLVVGLRDILHWRVVYRDSTWVVLTPPAATTDAGQSP